MHAFLPVPGGYASRLADSERTVLARLVADVAELLGARPDPAGSDPARPDAPKDDDVLAALDFAPASESLPDAPADPALARLLPPMSHHDPELAAELRSLTEDAVRGGKLARLTEVWRELDRPSGPGSVVVVRTGAEASWLAAITDVRLVLASRLGVDDDAAAEEVYRRAQRSGRRGPPPRGGDAGGDPARAAGPDGAAPEDDADAAEALTDALATLYAALTWWQESLLSAMQGDRSGQ